jgi:microcystin-dependent protein
LPRHQAGRQDDDARFNSAPVFGEGTIMEVYMGYVMYFAGSFAPQNFALCLGQTLAISHYSALFSLLGTTYGGNGTNTFMLPHLGGRTIVGTGQSPGVSHNYTWGEVAGTEQTTLLSSQMPMHVHALTQGTANVGVQAVTDNTTANTTDTPEAGARLGICYDSQGGTTVTPAIYVPAGTGGNTVNLASQVSGSTNIAGGSQPLSLMQPYLAMNAVIAMQGLYPSRN